MSGVELSTALLAELAGWQAMKQAREMVAGGRVLDASWAPPILRGTVQVGSGTCRSGLVLKSKSDVENICPCRDSRERGIICAHVVALGLHVLGASAIAPAASADQAAKASKGTVAQAKPEKPSRPTRALLRSEPGATGEELRIHVILPPNLPDALARGQVMVYLEGHWARGRMPLNALPMDRKFAFAPEDMALLDAVEALNEGDTPAMLRVNGDQMARLLPALVGHPRITSGKSTALKVADTPLRPSIRAVLKADGTIALERVGQPVFCIGSEPSWSFEQNTFRQIKLPASASGVMRGPTLISREEVPLFVSQTLPELQAVADVQASFSVEDFELVEGKPEFRLHLTGGIALLQAKLECLYGGVSVGEAPARFWLPDQSNPKRYTARDISAEQSGLGRLMRCGFSGPDQQGLYHLKNQEQILNFFAREYPRLQRDWRVTLEERLQKSTATNLERVEPRFEVTSSGEQWFDLQVTYGTRSGQALSPADIQRLLRSGQSHMRLANGKFAVLDTEAVEEFNEVLTDCAPEQRSGQYRVKQTQASFLQSTVERQLGWKLEASSAWAGRAAKQSGAVKLTAPSLGDLESVLRPYQKEGVAWLRFLRENGFGGILADDMGLGKTLQVLAHLAALRREQPKGMAAPWLVVCPSSLVYNWVAEAAKFTPELSCLALEGGNRQTLFQQIPKNDLVVTSYALLRRDAEFYRGLEFDTVALDEAQHIKNRETQNAQAVKSIRAKHKLVLTGTPLENSVLDLWSIFDFLMPGYLGGAKDFKERYEVPISREQNSAVKERLGRRVKPFMLRRMKREVAKDLPEKIEQISFCDMTEAQAGLYQQVLEATRTEIVNATGPENLAKTRMVVLTALLRLRQICCDPRLLNLEKKPEIPGEGVPEKPGSGKVELFSELLEEILDGGHRVLVFSQFTSMLGLLRKQLDERAIGYCYLDGSTHDRPGVVRKFQTDGQIPVFLISLKAGGVGLNLTAADTVIHFDPWWNPAVEAQATDRAHRIGQKQVVTSYKLITRGTVEEKILKLQQKKQSVINAMLGDEQQFAESLNWEEIQELLTT